MVKHSQVVVHVRRHYVRGTYASILKVTTTLVLQSLCFHKIGCYFQTPSRAGIYRTMKLGFLGKIKKDF